ncbi:MAG: FAD-binding monooxygenase, partial [Actinomycetes bacterium]
LLAPYVGAPQFLAVRDARSGRELTRMPLGDWIARRHGSPYWVAHRADLHRALRARAAAEPLIDLTADAAVVSVRQDDKSVTVSPVAGRWCRSAG